MFCIDYVRKIVGVTWTVCQAEWKPWRNLMSMLGPLKFFDFYMGHIVLYQSEIKCMKKMFVMRHYLVLSEVSRLLNTPDTLNSPGHNDLLVDQNTITTTSILIDTQKDQ